MAESMLPEEFEPLALPSDGAWASVGLRCGPELHAGRQSRVFRAVLDGGPIVVKLSDGRLADQSFFRRIELLASLAEVTSSVVGPIPIRSSLVNRVDQWLVVAYPYVSGEMPDVTSQRDVIRLASALAELHQALARHEPVDLPVVAALRAHHHPQRRTCRGTNASESGSSGPTDPSPAVRSPMLHWTAHSRCGSEPSIAG